MRAMICFLDSLLYWLGGRIPQQRRQSNSRAIHLETRKGQLLHGSIVQRSGCMATGNGNDHCSLQTNRILSSFGAVCALRSITPRCRFSAKQHRRGIWKINARRVPAVSRPCARIESRSGDAVVDRCFSGIRYGREYGSCAEAMRGCEPTARGTDQVAALLAFVPLSLIPFPLYLLLRDRLYPHPLIPIHSHKEVRDEHCA